MAAPDWVASNGYRILGLPANAGPAQVHAAAASLRGAASLGVERALENDPPELGAPRRMEGDILAAVGRLENPAQRLLDRLFWFNRTTSLADNGAGTSHEAVTAHDEALRSLLVALKAGNADVSPELWARALREWHAAVSSDHYWETFQRFELEADFEPPALPSELDELRGLATALAATPLVSLGQTVQDSGNIALLGRVAACLVSLAGTDAWATAALNELVESALTPFISRCEDIKATLESTLNRAADRAVHNQGPCAAALARFRGEIGPGLELLRTFIPPDSDGLLRARAAAARCLAAIASATTWTDDFVSSDHLYREALGLGEGTAAVLKIEQDLEGIQPAVRFQRVENESHRAGSPRAGAKAHAGRRFQFLGQRPFRPLDSWWLGLALGALAVLFIWLMTVLPKLRNTETATHAENSAAVASTPVTNGVSLPGPADAGAPPGSEATGLTGLIEAGRVRMAAIKGQLANLDGEIEPLTSSMAALKSELDKIEAQQKSRQIVDASLYNEKVDQYNSDLEKRKNLINQYNELASENNNLISNDQAMVNRYNNGNR